MKKYTMKSGGVQFHYPDGEIGFTGLYIDSKHVEKFKKKLIETLHKLKILSEEEYFDEGDLVYLMKLFESINHKKRVIGFREFEFHSE